MKIVKIQNIADYNRLYLRLSQRDRNKRLNRRLEH